MITPTADRGTLRSALELAGRAPSVHNTQPWRWRVTPDTVELRADLRRWLPLTDPDGRDLLLSCGAALHHLQVALAALDVAALVHRMPDPDEPDLLATVRVTAAEPPREPPFEMIEALQARRTDRRRFSDWPVPDPYLAELQSRAADFGALLRPVREGAARRALHRAVRAATADHESIAGYATELALWTGLLTGDEGVPERNLPPVAAVPNRRFAGTGRLADEQPEDGAALLVLGTTSDDQLAQLRAGEALSAVLLQATASGLASCPMSEPLELDRTREVLRDEVLGGTLCPQIVLRLGWAPTGDPLPPTPRRPVADQVDWRPLP